MPRGRSAITRPFPLFARASGFGPLFTIVARDFGEDAAETLRLNNHLPGFAERPVLDPMMPVPFHTILGAFADANRLMGDHEIGARIGVAMPAEAFGPYMAFALAAEQLGEVVLRAQQGSRLHTNGVSSHLSVCGGRACWRLDYAMPAAVDRDDHALHIIVPLLAMLRDFGGAEARDLTIHIVHGHAPAARRLEAIIGNRVMPRSGFYALTFPAEWLNRRRPAPAWTAAVSTDGLPQYLQRPLPTTLVEAVRRALAGRPLDADVDLASIAAELGRSGRTLQHGLAQEGAVYRDILRQVRIERAEQQLTRTARPIADIALEVGYTDQANFHRAFVAATGTTPGQRRAALRA